MEFIYDNKDLVLIIKLIYGTLLDYHYSIFYSLHLVYSGVF